MIDMKWNVNKIKKARAIKGLTQEQLSHNLGIHRTTLYKIENGQFGKPGTIKKIADALNLKMEELVLDDTKSSAA